MKKNDFVRVPSKNLLMAGKYSYRIVKYICNKLHNMLLTLFLNTSAIRLQTASIMKPYTTRIKKNLKRFPTQTVKV